MDGNTAQSKMDDDYWILVYYNGIWLITVTGGLWSYDILEGLIPLITLDSYRFGPFNNWVIFSSSVKELWGRRYNLLISGLLKTSVFLPMKRILHTSNTIAALSSFIMSGILHVYVIYITFGPGYELRSFSFFVIHGIICVLESFILPRKSSFLLNIIRIIFTLSFVVITTPIYTRPLLYPSMIGDTPWKIVPIFMEPYLPRLHHFISVSEYCF